MKRSDTIHLPARGRQQAAFCLCGVTILRKLLQALERELLGVQRHDDPEFVHRARVVLRRLRSLLPLFADCLPRKRRAAWDKVLRRTARALGKARDIDVQIAFVRTCLHTLEEERSRPGIVRVLLRLQQRRRQAQLSVLAAVEYLEEHRLLTRMQGFLRVLARHIRVHHDTTLSLDVYRHIGQVLGEQIDTVRANATLVTMPQQSTALHALRIAIKRLRYTLQTFVPLYPVPFQEPLQLVHELQDVLGEIHDTDVWLQELPQFQVEERVRTMEYFGSIEPFAPLAPGFAALEIYCQQRRTSAWEAFIHLWHQEGSARVWDTLLQTVQACGAPPVGSPTALRSLHD